jgi:hypothetical protein
MDPVLFASLAVGALTTLIRILRKEKRLQQFWTRLERNEKLVEFLKELGIRLPTAPESHEERMKRLFAKFREVSAESEEILSELEGSLRNKESIVSQLDQRHKELDQKIASIRQSPDYTNLRLLEMLEQMDKDQKKDSRRSAWRDYALFVFGVITPFALSGVYNLLTQAKPSP